MDFKKIETKWKKIWEKKKIFQAKDKGKKFYLLEMFPYPSATFIHVGHGRNYVIGDSFARFKRMRGFNVLYPMGWDAFGLPSENAAIKKGIHPNINLKESIKAIKDQFNALSLSYDWNREIDTSSPDYYKWTQWLFLQLFKKGLTYRKLAPGNWCPSCETTLANEDVKDEKCWRCDSEVIQKDIEQWFIKITDYADELLEGLDKIKWSERLKTMQRNWIGKSHGVDLFFKIKGSKEKIKTFTTRPDTYFGIAFVAMAPEHPLADKLVKKEYKKSVDKFKKIVKKQSELERISKEKIGVFTGSYLINPITEEKIPIWLANYVIMSYGTGVVIGVPTQDQRDFEFAREYGLRLKNVINPEVKELKEDVMKKAYTYDGVMTNSMQFDGMKSRDAIKAISDFLIKKKVAKKVLNYKIRDWCISRQRYWGCPIPIIHCEKCEIVPLKEKDLPLELPLDVDFTKKVPPLATNKKFVNTKCPKCGGKARRETDTMTTFVDSSWYFLRYASPKYKGIVDKKKAEYWMPIDQYIGGIEHAVGHLLYARFITKFLKKLGILKFDEPFMKLLNQGLVLKNGVKMSKSKGNIIDPRDVIKKYGVDTLRTYLMFMADPEKAIEWSDKDMKGIAKFIEKVISLSKLKENKKKKKYIQSVTQMYVRNVTENMENLKHNRAVNELMHFSDELGKYFDKECYKTLLKLLTPFAPHVCEELWSKAGKGLISVQKWPIVNEKLIDEEIEREEEIVSNLVKDIKHILKIVGKKAKKIYIYCIPKELVVFESSKGMLKKELGSKIIVYPSNKAEYDPENKAKKAKPGKPGILVE